MSLRASFVSFRVACIACLLSCALAAQVNANEGDPLALIRTESGNLRIETMGGLSVEIIKAVNDSNTEQLYATLVRRSKNGQPDNPSDVTLQLTHRADVDHVWDRQPNSVGPTFRPAAVSKDPSPNSVRITAADGLVVVKVDGLCIACFKTAKLNEAAIKKVAACDALIADVPDGQLQLALSLAKKSKAKRLIVNADAAIDGAVKNAGNTLAISASPDDSSDGSFQIIQFGNAPIELPKELTQLIEAKEAACRASQAVFAPLSAKQMNFRPENGSHTPRWNAEHMMGRELLFFSQIFHAIDPTIPVMDLNPKQMPTDYQAKHPDWSGAEEAWQMQRVSALTRRFAHLLVDLPLDEKAPDSRWTPRGLLKQMERHYGEHTANVQLKFKLPGWPAK